VSGYRVGVEQRFRGGEIGITAVLSYADGVKVHWRMNRKPDLSWLADKAGSDGEIRQVNTATAFDEMWELWSRSSIKDGSGRESGVAPERTWPSEGGLEGFLSAPIPAPIESRQLILQIGGTDLVIPLVSIDTEPGPSSFIAGYPGPRAPAPFHGGAVKLISVLLYENAVTIEWLLDPLPDLSWLYPAADTAQEAADAVLPNPSAATEIRMARSARAAALWLHARLADRLGTPYVGSLGYSGTFRGGGYKGETHFLPRVPPDVDELNLVLYDLSYFVPLRQHRNPRSG
jgi:hypothetical protein